MSRSEPKTSDYLAENGKTFTLKVKPSFFQVSLGVLFTFGR